VLEQADVAREALRQAWNGKRVTMGELWRYAAICVSVSPWADQSIKLDTLARS